MNDSIDRVLAPWPGQEKEWMDCELPEGFAICVGTLTGTKPHYAYIAWNDSSKNGS